MASLAIPLLESAAVRVLAALGVGAVAGAAGEAAKEKARQRAESRSRISTAGGAERASAKARPGRISTAPVDERASGPANARRCQPYRTCDRQLFAPWHPFVQRIHPRLHV